MTAVAATPLFAVSVLAWIMIGLPIVLILIAAVMYLRRPKRSTEEIERAQRASSADPRRPAGPMGRPPGL